MSGASSGVGGQEEYELLATVAGEQVGGTTFRLPDSAGEDSETVIACRMSVGVVIRLEIIGVDHEQANRVSGSISSRPFDFKSLFKAPSIANSRQWIGGRQLFHLLVRELELGLKDFALSLNDRDSENGNHA